MLYRFAVKAQMYKRSRLEQIAIVGFFSSSFLLFLMSEINILMRYNLLDKKL